MKLAASMPCAPPPELAACTRRRTLSSVARSLRSSYSVHRLKRRAGEWCAARAREGDGEERRAWRWEMACEMEMRRCEAR